VLDGQQKGIGGIKVTIKDQEKELCSHLSANDGTLYCIVDSAKLKFGTRISLTSVDTKNVWTTITTYEQIPLNTYSASYKVNMYQPI
jgi:hypothetical protein